MISKNSANETINDEFKDMAHYFGIAIQSNLSDIAQENPTLIFRDIELFFLSATLHLKTSRMTEGFLCWLLAFGHLLSPSKIRRLIQSGQDYDQAILGGFIEFLVENNIIPHQWKIVRPLCKKKLHNEQLLDGPVPRSPASYFLKYRILAPQFKLETTKFLVPTAVIYKNCVELRNRALFGSVVNADVASYLQKKTHHHKARVFEVYKDILAAS